MASRSAANKLLKRLSSADLDLLEPGFVPVSLPLRQDLEKPNKRIEHVFFMDSAIASVVAVHPRDIRVEIGIIGCEGMTGTAVVMGSDRSPHSTYVQVGGQGQRLSVSDLNKAMDESKTLRPSLMRFAQAFSIQTAHTAVANARASLEVRLARWLLMAHDRTPGNDLFLTHEFLSLMLASRRAGVTEAIHALTKKGLIASHRGEITILDRKGIEKIAGKFYGVPESEYRRLMN
jgi:Crp-like helix-turn-helix domain